MYKDLTGRKFNMLSVVGLREIKTNKNGHKDAYWNCKCECGKTKVVKGSSLKNGNTKSCGCLLEKQLDELHIKNSKDSFINDTKVELLTKKECNKDNKSSGVRGVYYAKHCKRWYSRIKYQGRDHFLGYFETIDEAETAYKSAKRNLYGTFLDSLGKEI